MCNNKLGVIIGRFQCPYFKSGYLHLISQVLHNHDLDDIIILIGSAQEKFTLRNPLPYKIRKRIIEDDLKSRAIGLFYLIEIYPLIDVPNDDYKWSDIVDKIVDYNLSKRKHLSGAILYGSRDSFIPYYHGKYETKYIEYNKNDLSSTEIRNSIDIEYCEEFYNGIIWTINQLNKRRS
jgi:bifunctional NMN adenylyltransferase/nudix hydrolase